ncbi:initiator tRNA phosphoribosyl transferase family protein [Striga hermonthica]|uniref:Initiator tRNA phosphoribosyl transferase family protein n=1 Tax=Striga hermonthica TaxID=68872 RepID=A0A9N7NX08_STRHE|nr:initiator tRNA phosphoribosyl transferase family protein [Striga hermonthica]
MEEERQTIYKISRTIKRRESSLYNALRSIYQDSIFVGEISQLWPDLPLLANLRCGLWHRARVDCKYSSDIESATSNAHDSREQFLSDWDCSLHLPLWVSESEKAMIEKRLEGWTKELEASGADIASLALSLRKPLRPLWISQRTVIWLNEVPEYDSWDFTPIILVSASSSDGTFQHRTTSEFSWNYIAGAGDDEESWARGLSPHLFWKHAYDIISSGPELCNQKTANIVEKDRVSRARRGENAPQVSVKPSKIPGNTISYQFGDPLVFDDEFVAEGDKRSDDCCMYFLGSTGIAVGKSRLAIETPPAFCILNCDRESLPVSLENLEMYMHLPIVVCMTYYISICVSLAILTSLYDEAGHFDEGRSFNETQITKMELRRRLLSSAASEPVDQRLHASTNLQHGLSSDRRSSAHSVHYQSHMPVLMAMPKFLSFATRL